MITPSRVILIATRNDHLRHAVAETLVGQGYQARFVGLTEAETDDPLDQPAACLVLESDLGSPQVAALLVRVTSRQPGLPVVLIQSDSELRGWGMEPFGGFRGYLPAPFAGRGLLAMVERALRNSPPAAVAPPAESAVPHQGLAVAALETLVHAMEAKDPHLPGHSLRVAELATAVATRLGRSEWEVEEVRQAGRLHDVGMIALREGLLTKEGPLTPDEYAEVKRHPVVGHGILSGYPYMERVASYVRGHHERWDGTGYPDGLKGEEIPWGAQVIAAAETFDALTSPRSYRAAHSFTHALERIYAQSADLVNPQVMRVLGRVVSQREGAGV